MNNYFKLVFIFFFSSIINAQTTDVITEIDSPLTIAFNGNDLYIAKEFEISKINITDSTPTEINVIIEGVSLPTSMESKGNFMYFADYDGLSISKINMTDPTPTTTVDLYQGLQLEGPTGIAFYENELYIGVAFGPNSASKISKIVITDSTPAVVDFITEINRPSELVFNGDELYFSQFINNKISKINITDSSPTVIDVLTGLQGPSGLAFNGNDLYFSQFNANKISKINITESTPTVIDVATGLERPNGLAFHGSDLYISETQGNKISKLSNVLSITDNYLDNDIKLFPNPSNDFIQVSSLKKTETYIVCNLLGVEILNGIISNNEKISIQNLPSGLYFLKLDNTSIKFIKK